MLAGLYSHMLIGSKPLAEMSDDEMLAAIEELRSAREALRADAIKQKAETGKIVKVKKEPKAAKVDVEMDAILKGLMGDD